jgi:hypothetical protein
MRSSSTAVPCGLGGFEEAVHAEEAVEHAVDAQPRGLDPGGFELVRVRLALVAQRVVLGGDDQRRGQTAKVGGAQRGGERVQAVLWAR